MPPADHPASRSGTHAGPVAGIARAPLAELVTILLEPGADLYGGLLEGLADAGARRATVVSGIGALQRTTARNVRHPVEVFPIRDADRAFVTVPGPCEIVSLTGWLAPFASGEPHLHLHFAASYVERDESGDAVRLIGGHLSPGACRAYVHVAVTFAVHGEVDGRPDAAYLFDDALQVERLSVPAAEG
ncbi:MAG TPA: PPC domain-containing DNA-binding protein [Trueperaceae bacterium]|nr:PPC domain-containing DNA-binding protein [Trueperaceae bacterium]